LWLLLRCGPGVFQLGRESGSRRRDGAATVDRFADRLRDQIDLGALNTELLAVVRTTVRPEHASSWIRPPESG
jgi:hypothetical protein